MKTPIDIFEELYGVIIDKEMMSDLNEKIMDMMILRNEKKILTREKIPSFSFMGTGWWDWK